MSLEAIERDLLALKPILRCQSVNVVGGEPTLHKQLVEILKLVKRIQIGGCTLITNGTLLPRMSDDFWKELDYLSISMYPTLDRACIALAYEKQKEFGFGIGIRTFTEFHRQFRTEPGDGSNFHNCHWKSDCYTVHDGFFFLCPQSAFFPKRFMDMAPSTDGLPLAEITEELLYNFIHRTEPLNACRICMANEMKPAPWKESSRKEWLEVSKAI